MGVKCFFIEPTEKCKRALRRYRPRSKPRNACPNSPAFTTHPEYAYHDAQTPLEDGYAHRLPQIEWLKRCGATQDRIDAADPNDWVWDLGPDEKPPADDPRWPTQCKCGYAFEPDDEFQLFTDVIYRRTDTGEETTIRDAPDGAMWDADWLKRMYAPTTDGRFLMVRCPGGSDWCIDARASNCTLPDDRVHHCWVRHGEPPNLTVDKNGFTCAAGGGSIIAGAYHGFLRNGSFEP